MFDWNLAIERNKDALTQIVAGLFGLVRVAPHSVIPDATAVRDPLTPSSRKEGRSAPEGKPQWIPVSAGTGMTMGRDSASHPHPEPVEGRGCGEFSHKHNFNLTTILRAAEAALRRLIMLYVIAKGIKARVYAKRDDRLLPDFASFKRAENPLPKFNLIDPRPSLMVTWVNDESDERTDTDPFLILSLSKDEEVYGEQTLRQAQGEGIAFDAYSRMSAAAFLARLQAFDHALNNLPKEARRMAREIEKRQRLRSLPLTEDKPLRGSWADPPIRIGKPPGHRDRGDHEVDHILKE
ncbi:MAG: hypothetical protein AAFN43_08115, partial [Pseudomonadota bacterium]